MTHDELAAIVEGIAPVIYEHLAKVTRRVDAVEKSLAAFTAKPHVKFCGVWATGSEYQPGDAVTHQGGLWIAKVATPGKPSEDFVGWQLAVKSWGGPVTPTLRTLTPADRRQVLMALEPIVDRELVAVAALAEVYWAGHPADIRARLCALLVADVRRECWALVRELLTPRCVH